MTTEEREKLEELANDASFILQLLDEKDLANADLGLTAIRCELAHWAETGKMLTYPSKR